MANPYIGFRCPQDIYDALEKYLEVTGQEKTEYIVDLLRKELGVEKNSTLGDRVESLEYRVANIEARLDA